MAITKQINYRFKDYKSVCVIVILLYLMKSAGLVMTQRETSWYTTALENEHNKCAYASASSQRSLWGFTVNPPESLTMPRSENNSTFRTFIFL